MSSGGGELIGQRPWVREGCGERGEGGTYREGVLG
jgi:hypothetical protein